MPFEQARRRLMSQTVEWGAPPPTRSHMAPATLPPESGTTTPLSSSVHRNATTTSRMEYVVEDAPRSKIFVSSKDWTVDALLQQGPPSFKKVARISIKEPLPKLRSAIEFHERSGQPLIIEGWHNHKDWPMDIFTVDWFREHGQQEAKARNVHDWTDINIPIHELIRKQRAIPTSITPGVWVNLSFYL
ncbi:hypothetical protein PILCRDRAFT_305221 [Piloderma croceum F 1598]|uniref:Uncharacterized protein n=1 Tax=Piloderma croceum (strain F 1598) TaxID=765440 RepID=A0A0C3G9D0_PILCF|nr:hypothetical protein PILCRDRAFT_305221 [Piloderma croceum F 1598]